MEAHSHAAMGHGISESEMARGHACNRSTSSTSGGVQLPSRRCWSSCTSAVCAEIRRAALCCVAAQSHPQVVSSAVQPHQSHQPSDLIASAAQPRQSPTSTSQCTRVIATPSGPLPHHPIHATPQRSGSHVDMIKSWWNSC